MACASRLVKYLQRERYFSGPCARPGGLMSLGGHRDRNSVMIKNLHLARKIGRRYRELGLVDSLRYSAMRAIDLTQERVFDWIHGVDTSGVALPTIAGGQGYKGSLPHLVRKVLKTIQLTYEDYTLVDLGSGKGRTLLIASEFPFRRIIGIEADPALNAIAEHNFTRYRTRRQKCRDLISLCGDVREFVFPAEPLLVYLFNPFTEPIISQVLENIRASLRERPRPLLMVYLRPLFAGPMDRSNFLKSISYRKSRLIENYSYAVYGNAEYLERANNQEIAGPAARVCRIQVEG